MGLRSLCQTTTTKANFTFAQYFCKGTYNTITITTDTSSIPDRAVASAYINTIQVSGIAV